VGHSQIAFPAFLPPLVRLALLRLLVSLSVRLSVICVLLVHCAPPHSKTSQIVQNYPKSSQTDPKFGRNQALDI
jgi:hypothetical protein